ncbi:hypothetical protein Tco_1084638 [Tanacetum coccineum]
MYIMTSRLQTRYPVDHPLHNKYQPPQRRTTTPGNQSFNSQPRNRAVNMIVVHDTPVETEASSANMTTLPTDCSITARMDLLQNQLNQVLLMMQNNSEASTSRSYNFMAGKRLISHYVTIFG